MPPSGLTEAEEPGGLPDLYELAPCGLLLLDASYRILRANPYFLDLAGLRAEQVSEGIRLHAVLSVAGRIFVQARLQQELAITGRLEELALDIVRRDGSRVPVMFNAMQDLDAAGRPGLIRMAMWGAAAKRAYEAEAPKARKDAETAHQAKADFLANVSHEIRTPLNGVIGIAALLESTALDARQSEMVATIQASGAILERLVSDILDVSKVQAGSLELQVAPFDLEEKIAATVALARLQGEERGLAVHVDVAPEAAGRYLGDAVRLKQVLGNLLSNAVKFTRAGEVRIEVGLDTDGAVLIAVTDTGIGFDEATGDTLFQRFQQGDSGITRRYGGTGLGLSICKALVELMGGAITARSRPGEGSRFALRLPLPRLGDAAPPGPAAAPLAAAAPEASEAGEAAETALRVLLVEDNLTNQRVVQMILAQFDAALTITGDGAEGLDAWRAGRFDVVLMDLQMPVMDGLTAIRHIRQEEAADLQRSRTPIAVLSANAMDHHRAEALAAGADLHLSKPITPAGLVAGIQAALAGR